MGFKSAMGNAADKAGDIAMNAVKRGSEVLESAKLNFALRSEEKKLERMFSILGKLFYEQASGTDVRTQIKTQIMEINEEKLVIENIKSEINDAAGKDKCEFCGSDVDVLSAYCPSCGRSRGLNITKEAEPTVSDDEYDAEVMEKAMEAEAEALGAIE